MTAPNGARPQPLMFPLQIPPSMIPSAIEVQTVNLADGTTLVMLAVHTPMGVQICLMEPAAAVKVAADLTQHGKQASSGIILPPGFGSAN